MFCCGGKQTAFVTAAKKSYSNQLTKVLNSFSTMQIQSVIGNILLLFSITSYVKGYNILVLTPITSPSHTNVFKSLVAELVERGHFVTYWNGLQTGQSSFKGETTINPRLRLLSSPNLAHLNSHHQIDFNDRDSPFHMLFRIPSVMAKYCKAVYEDDVFHQLMNSEERYDLIIIDAFGNDCSLLLAEVLDVPFIYLNCFPPSPWILHAIGSPLGVEQFPNPTGLRDRMTLWQRTFNTLTSVFAVYFHRRCILPVIDDVAANVLGIKNLTSMVDIEERYLSLLLTNTHFSINNQLPTSPAVIEVGGMHLSRRHQQLPKELLSFVNDSDDAGFIIVSFGSMLRGDDVPMDFCQIFLSTFARLPQRVIWKWENQSKLENYPTTISSNVKTMSWLPQEELLAHPKARLLISHGGLLSKQETVYHGVPAIFLPVSSDQPTNAQKAEDDGYAIRLKWDGLTEDILYNAIQLIINNPKYNQRAKEVSALMRDQIDNPLDRAVYWTEYVIRHRGAPHLRSVSRKLFLHQRGLVDIFVLISVVFLFIAYFIFRLCRICTSTFIRKGLITDDMKKNN